MTGTLSQWLRAVWRIFRLWCSHNDCPKHLYYPSIQCNTCLKTRVTTRSACTRGWTLYPEFSTPPFISLITTQQDWVIYLIWRHRSRDSGRFNAQPVVLKPVIGKLRFEPVFEFLRRKALSPFAMLLLMVQACGKCSTSESVAMKILSEIKHYPGIRKYSVVANGPGSWA